MALLHRTAKGASSGTARSYPLLAPWLGTALPAPARRNMPNTTNLQVGRLSHFEPQGVQTQAPTGNVGQIARVSYKAISFLKKYFVMGTIDRPIEVRSSARTGQPWTSFAIKVHSNPQDPQDPRTMMIYVKVFGPLATSAATAPLYSMLAISGRPQMVKYVDKNGIMKESFEVVADSIAIVTRDQPTAS